MKKGMFKFSAKIALPVIALGVFITACHNNDTNPTFVHGTETSAMKEGEGTATDNTHVAPTDTTNAGTAAAIEAESMAKMATDTSAKAKSDKKGKKGKVTIAASDVKAGTGSMDADKDGFYSNTEVLPAFPGGQKALERFFEDNIEYPEVATESGTEGTVKLIFNVDENGKIYQPQTVGSKIGSGLEEEAIRVFNKMPKWMPGKIKGKNVKTRFTLPIRFELG